MPAVVLPAASGARAQLDAGRVAVAAAAFGVDRIAALAGVGVGAVVAAGRPLAPVVTQDTVFSTTHLAVFARGAGGRFGATGMESGVIIRNP